MSEEITLPPSILSASADMKVWNYVVEMQRKLEKVRQYLTALAQHDLGAAFGDDSGLCWCDPFYRGDSWPGHDELCSNIRALMKEIENV